MPTVVINAQVAAALEAARQSTGLWDSLMKQSLEHLTLSHPGTDWLMAFPGAFNDVIEQDVDNHSKPCPGGVAPILTDVLLINALGLIEEVAEHNSPNSQTADLGIIQHYYAAVHNALVLFFEARLTQRAQPQPTADGGATKH